MKYNVTHSCGHVEVLQLFGKNSERERRIAWEEERECSECSITRRATLGRKEGISGSNAQVAWAYDIRTNFLAALKADKKNEEVLSTHPVVGKFYEMYVEYFASQRTAKWWIDHRNDLAMYIPGSLMFMADLYVRKSLNEETMKSSSNEERLSVISATLNDIESWQVAALIEGRSINVEPPSTIDEDGVSPEAGALSERAERTITPAAEPITEAAIISTPNERVIHVRFAERMEWVSAFMRTNGYRWDTCYWVRDISVLNGPQVDRVVEIATALLAKGVPVRLGDKDIREKVMAGEYAPEQTLWIRTLRENVFHVYWAGYNNAWYQAAKKIKGATWDSVYKMVAVPSSSVDELADFAELNNFKYTPKAQKLADSAREAKLKALIAPEIKKQKAVQPKPAEVLPSLEPEDSGIDDSLKD